MKVQHRSPLRVLAQAAKEFLSRYLKNRGYRDGWRGFYLSLFMAFYRVGAAAKLKELEVLGSRDHIIAGYNTLAERILSEYGEQVSQPIPEGL